MFGRRRFYAVHKEARTIVIQAAIRAYVARKKYKKVMRGIIKLQGHVRRKAAKKELKRLKVWSIAKIYKSSASKTFVVHLLALLAS